MTQASLFFPIQLLKWATTRKYFWQPASVIFCLRKIIRIKSESARAKGSWLHLAWGALTNHAMKWLFMFKFLLATPAPYFFKCLNKLHLSSPFFSVVAAALSIFMLGCSCVTNFQSFGHPAGHYPNLGLETGWFRFWRFFCSVSTDFGCGRPLPTSKGVHVLSKINKLSTLSAWSFVSQEIQKFHMTLFKISCFC